VFGVFLVRPARLLGGLLRCASGLRGFLRGLLCLFDFLFRLARFGFQSLRDVDGLVELALGRALPVDG
jgi:hypothetical protein